jgi:glutamate formiminotransferase/formiminotetrahydrofolate cyclodeaminase
MSHPNVSGSPETVRGFVERVASPNPIPGGGSVAALAGALGIALGQMAIEITRTRKNYQEHSSRYLDALSRLAAYRTTLLELVDVDAAAYGKVMAAYKISKDSPGREDAIQDALIHATEVPARTASNAGDSLELLEDLQPLIHPNVASDLHVGLQMLRSAVAGGIANMRINIRDIKNAEVRTRYENRMREMAPWTSSH